MKCRARSMRSRFGMPAISSGKATLSIDVAPREGRFLLEHHADRGVRAGNCLAGDRDAAVIAVEQSADDVEQGRLAAARRPDHRQELAGRDAERDIIERGERALGGGESA